MARIEGDSDVDDSSDGEDNMMDYSVLSTEDAENKTKLDDSDMSDSSDSTIDTLSPSENKTEEQLEIDKTHLNILSKAVEENPLAYDPHLAYVEAALKHGELEMIRAACEGMNKVYPLTPALWGRWLAKEISVDRDKQSISNVDKLFQRALDDYFSVDVQLQYLTWSTGGDRDNARQAFEKAVKREGLHPLKGLAIWDTYRLFEIAHLSLTEDESAEQKEHVLHLIEILSRQLATCLDGNLEAMDLIKKLSHQVSDPVDIKAVEAKYESAQKRLAKYLEYEKKLQSLADDNYPERLVAYEEYFAAASSQDPDTNFIESLYNRATSDLCLNADLWIQYCEHVSSQGTDKQLYTVQRALRNCPWSGQLWAIKIACQEKQKLNVDQIRTTFEEAYAVVSTSPEQSLIVWLAYLEYLRRHTVMSSDKDKECLRKTFSLAVDALWKFGDSDLEVMKFWARLEYTQLGDPAKGRELWNQVLNSGNNKGYPYLWLEMAKLEEGRGPDQARKIYRRAVLECREKYGILSSAWLAFERLCGTVETINACQKTCKARLKQVAEFYEPMASSDRKTPFQRGGKADTNRKAPPLKRKHQFKDGNEFKDKRPKQNPQHKVPPPPGYKKSPIKVANKSNVRDDITDHFKKPVILKTVEEEPMDTSSNGTAKTQDKSKQHEDKNIRHDSTKDEISVFISNLDYSVTEDQIKDALMSKCNLGIADVRLVKGPTGVCKGFAYVQLRDADAVTEALALDRLPLCGRPMFISRCRGDKGQRQRTFKYPESLEKNKLFIRNLPFDMTPEEMRDIFGKHGEIRDLRMVTYRNGNFKGLAYVEYTDVANASAALLSCDNLTIRGHTISVALSAPPPRAPQRSEPTPSLGDAVRHRISGERKAKMSFIPRVVQKSVTKALTNEKTLPPSTSPPKQECPNVENKDISATAPSSSAKSNADFRSMLLGNK